MDNITRTILFLQEKSIIPESGNFDITESILNEYIKCYAIFAEKGNGRHDIDYSRKLAGLTFLKRKINEGIPITEIKEGLVYMVTNSAWPDMVKLGMTVDLDRRIQQYQTYSPYRDYKVHKYEFVLDRRAQERYILSLAKSMGSEWVSKRNKYIVEAYLDSLSSRN